MHKDIELPCFNNNFLRSLAADDVRELASRLEFVEMPLEMKIYEPHAAITHLYFPETSIISIVTTLENGNGVETGIIGREGVSGLETMLTENAVPREAMVQLGGSGYRTKVEDFRTLFTKSRSFSARALHYLYTFITQISQNSACLCYHPIEKRLARWLLMFRERAEGDELRLTQEFIALMLGVHRQNLNKNINNLQKKNLISYNRGRVQIVDREALAKTACECYGVIRTAVDTYSQATAQHL